ncbi:hypothetical protein TNIN_121791 [Trichonephila inaurata madagascariensis]|uniref:Uncharacterized protein n=1 Tax=Trichonephila inaurata madagascariensis TaxID=2747483 RepID=A0A8X6WRY0_9ARAC|nr:hypothetical protein TNIN_121791 [Trichonephila inaurata madagascariensis]
MMRLFATKLLVSKHLSWVIWESCPSLLNSSSPSAHDSIPIQLISVTIYSRLTSEREIEIRVGTLVSKKFREDDGWQLFHRIERRSEDHVPEIQDHHHKPYLSKS